MRKVLLVISLALAVVGSWAFYPKAEGSAGYTMVISRFAGSAFNAKNSLAVIAPDGQVQAQEIKAKTGTLSAVTGSFDQLHLTELAKLNELRQAGWRVVTTSQMTIGGGISETVYLLEK